MLQKKKSYYDLNNSLKIKKFLRASCWSLLLLIKVVSNSKTANSIWEEINWVQIKTFLIHWGLKK